MTPKKLWEEYERTNIVELVAQLQTEALGQLKEELEANTIWIKKTRPTNKKIYYRRKYLRSLKAHKAKLVIKTLG